MHFGSRITAIYLLFLMVGLEHYNASIVERELRTLEKTISKNAH